MHVPVTVIDLIISISAFAKIICYFFFFISPFRASARKEYKWSYYLWIKIEM